MCCAPNVYMFVYTLIGAHVVPLTLKKKFQHSQEFSLMQQSKCLNTQRSLAVVAALFGSVLWYCDMYNGVLAVKWYRARRYLSVNSGYQYPSRKMALVQKLLSVILWVSVSR